MTPQTLPDVHRDQLESLAAGYWWHEHRVEAAADALARFVDAPRAAIVDAGCAGGATTGLLAKALKARKVLAFDGLIAGIDADHRGAGAVRQRGMLFSAADLCAQPAPGLRDFGLFSALDVLEHAQDDRRFLANLARALTPGAYGVVAVPAFQSFYSGWDRALGHLRRYDEASLTQALASAGYQTLWSTYLYSFAAPLAPLRLSRSPRFPELPGWFNAALRAACWSERALLKAGRLPFGTSLLAVVKLLS